MKKILLALFTGFALSTSAQETMLAGFEYNAAPAAPDGMEWQSPERLALNKEQPRAWMFSYATQEEALRVLPEGSTYYQSLDGTWKFQWVPEPSRRDSTFHQLAFDDSRWDDIEVPGCWNVQGLQKDGTMKYGVPIYVNQKVIFQHRVAVGDWKGGVMRTPPTDWTTYKYRNEVGSYRRTFQIPAQWAGRDIYINFDGVDSFFYLWINGHYVGFSKNSRNTARFNITPWLNPYGDNVVAVAVYRNSDGSFLEAQDMFRLPGIYRSTYLTANPQVEIRDLAVRTAFVGQGTAIVNVEAEIRNPQRENKSLQQLQKFLAVKTTNKYTLNYQVYPVKLYSDDTEPMVASLQNANPYAQIYIPNARAWSAEEPNRYVLVATLTNKKGEVVERVSTYFGIRKVEIRETAADEDEFHQAGRYYYINDMPVKLKGVNRHENNPSRGHAITREQMEREVMLMKAGNINHVRNSHYSCDPYWYYLCDKYGIYLEDEANIESHEYYYGDASLSHPAEWRAAHIARNMELVHAHVNAPSVVIWSLGNEAGPGDNFKAAYEAIRQFDKSRPVQYERNNDIVDMGSNQYPSVSWVQFAAAGGKGPKYPFQISEYAHSMGNAGGNLIDYWKAIESSNYICGGAIWDWVDQAIDAYKPDGTKYFGYGGDHGDKPNDGMFCMNGVMLPDLSPKPEYFDVKHVYQNVGVTLDSIWTMGKRQMVRLLVTNKNYFIPLDYVDISVVVMRDGFDVSRSTIPRDPEHGMASIAPRATEPIVVPMRFENEEFDAHGYDLRVEFLLREDMPWAKKGYVQMSEQVDLWGASDVKPIYMPSKRNAKLHTASADQKTTITGGDTPTGTKWQVVFDDAQGTIHSLSYDGQGEIEPGCGPVLDALRAPVDNDNWFYQSWYQNGLHNLGHKALTRNVYTRRDGAVVLNYTVESRGTKGQIRGGSSGRYTIEDSGEPSDFSLTSNIVWTVYPDGSIECETAITGSNPKAILPRLGYLIRMPKRFEAEGSHMSYFGRGPQNNYTDRMSGMFRAVYETTVKEQFVAFPKPQDMANHEGVLWLSLSDATGHGLVFGSLTGNMSTSVLPWSDLQLTYAPHPCELPESDHVYVHLDAKVTALGGNSCGQGGPLTLDRVYADAHTFGFFIRPTATANVNKISENNFPIIRGGDMPIALTRDSKGEVKIVYNEFNGESVSYAIQPLGSKNSKQKGKVYTGERIDMRAGGTITVWHTETPTIRTSQTFEKVEFVPVTILACSSEEPGEEATRLVDGKPETIWHTAYGVTVTKYPHTVDFDCGEEKMIKGFTYLPRQDGPNGDVKGYRINLSTDGRTWGQPVCEGEFPHSKKEQKVLFATPQRARYLRFTTLSSQNGADFASGAEFTVLAE